MADFAAELDAMKAVCGALEPLDEETRGRVLQFANSRYGGVAPLPAPAVNQPGPRRGEGRVILPAQSAAEDEADVTKVERLERRHREIPVVPTVDGRSIPIARRERG